MNPIESPESTEEPMFPQPRLRDDLHVDEGEDVIRLRSPSQPEAYSLYPLEYQVAQLLDGKSTLKDITKRAHALGYPITIEQVDRFVRELAGHDLVTNALPEVPVTDEVALQPVVSDPQRRQTKPTQERASTIVADFSTAYTAANDTPGPGDVPADNAEASRFRDIAIVMAAQGDFESARHYLLAALEKDPTDQRSLALLSSYSMASGPEQGQLGDSQAASQALVRANQPAQPTNPVDAPTQPQQVISDEPNPFGEEYAQTEQVALVEAPYQPGDPHAAQALTSIDDADLDDAFASAQSSQAVDVYDEEYGKAAVDAALQKKVRQRLLKRVGIGAGAFLLVAFIASLIPRTYQVQAEMVVEHSDMRDVPAQQAGRVSKVYVENGDLVEAGQLLAEISSPEIEGEVAQLQAVERQRLAELEQVERGMTPEEVERIRQRVAIARSRFAFASKDYKNKVRGGATVARRELDHARNELAVKKAELESVELELAAAVAGNRVELVRLHKAKLDQARADLSLAKHKHSLLQIRSPIDGIVVGADLKKLMGKYVTRGEVTMTVTEGSESTAVLQVKQEDIAYVQLGQKVEFWLSALPGRSFFGTVDFISPVADANEQGTPFFVVYAAAPNEVQAFRPGMQGIAAISTEEKSLLWIMAEPVMRGMRRLIYGV